MLKLIATGNLGKDQITRTVNGKNVTNFSVGSPDKRTKTTTWLDCSYWQAPEGLLQYLTKGTKVLIDGDFYEREHEGRKYLTVTIRSLELIGGVKPADAQVAGNDSPKEQVAEDLPF